MSGDFVSGKGENREFFRHFSELKEGVVNGKLDALLYSHRFGFRDVLTVVNSSGAQVSRTKLQNWINRNPILSASLRPVGTGSRRQYTGRDILAIIVVKYLADFRVPREIASYLWFEIENRARSLAVGLADRPNYKVIAFPVPDDWKFVFYFDDGGPSQSKSEDLPPANLTLEIDRIIADVMTKLNDLLGDNDDQ